LTGDWRLATGDWRPLLSIAVCRILIQKQINMLRNYFKITWRNIWKNKTYSAINILGLSIGLTACIMIMMFVFYEKSFDGMHKKNIYRLDEVQKFEGMVAPQNVALSMFPMGPTLKSEFPEVLNFTRINGPDKTDFIYKDKKVFLTSMYMVDSTFLQLFDFKLLKGDRKTALEKPGSIVLTEESARKFFGSEDAIGKNMVHYGRDTFNCIVTGVLQDVPKNSHLQFDALLSFNTIYNAGYMENWGGNWLVTYLDLRPNTDVKAMEKKFPAYLKRHMRDENWKNYELFLQPLKDVHASSTNITHDYLNFQKFDKTYTYIFLVIAIIVLLIAGINFMNLSTARSAERAREVGIRKSVGAQRFQLGFQFLVESVVLSLIALAIALCLVVFFRPYVSELSERDLRLPLFSNAWILLYILGATVILGILSGLYPAAYLSSFQPVRVLKGSVQTGSNKSLMRNILVVGQFASAIFLIIATVFAVKQMVFMRTQDPGFNRDQVMIIPFNSKTLEKFKALKQELLKNSLITAVSASQQQLGNNLHQSGMKFQGDGPARELTSSRAIVDPDFLSLYRIPILEGRNFSKENPAENGKTYIINETLAQELLKDKPGAPRTTLLGKQFGFSGMDSLGTIIGIAKDFNFNSLHHKIETLFLFNQIEWGFSEMSVRINGQKAKEAIAFVESTWNKIASGNPFEYVFLDDHFARMYKADEQVSKIIGILATLAVIISCLGLFGLASYSAEKRVKEIGIRKVLGASVQDIVSMLSRDFLKLVLIANLIAWPIAWFSINNWLQDFAYRIPVSWWVFLSAGIVAILIAVLTVSFQAIKAAVANPVKSLRTE
jgi:putative ABC transport system permease protein